MITLFTAEHLSWG